MLFHLAGKHITAEIAPHSGHDVLTFPMKQMGHVWTTPPKPVLLSATRIKIGFKQLSAPSQPRATRISTALTMISLLARSQSDLTLALC